MQSFNLSIKSSDGPKMSGKTQDKQLKASY